MGVFLLLKLESLPIVDTDKIESALLSLASVDVELQVLSRMATDYKTHRKYFKEYRSSAEIYAYATEQIQCGNMMLGRFTWKMVWPCLVLYGGVRGIIRYASPPSAYVCIIRAGPSTWLTCDFSAMEQDIEDTSDSPLDTSQYPYVGSLRGNIFHRSDQPCAEKIPAENLLGFESITDAIDCDYKPCARCKPSQTKLEPVATTKPKTKAKAKTKRKTSPEKEYVCVASADGRYFHRPNCGSVKNIREENLIGFYSTGEPRSLGFKRCGRCEP